MTNPLFTIKVQKDAGPLLRKAIVELIEPYKCKSREMSSSKDLCVDPVLVAKEMDRVLQGGRIDFLKAPDFYKVIKDMAGEDGILEQSEVNSDNLRSKIILHLESLLDGLKPKLKDDPHDKINMYGISAEAVPQIVHKEFIRKHGIRSDDIIIIKQRAVPSFFTTDDNGHPPIFEPSTREYRQAILTRLEHGKEKIDGTIKRIEHVWLELYKGEASYRSIISPANLFGLSLCLPGDGSPFSAMEFKGVSDVLRQLWKIRTGFVIVKNRVKTGRDIDPENEYVRSFLASPFAEGTLIERNCDRKTCENYKRQVEFCHSMIKMMMANGAENLAAEFAATYAKLFDGDDEATERIYSPLPSVITRYLDGSVRNVVNATLAADDLALMVLGVGAAKYLGKAVWAMKAGLKLNAFVNGSRFLSRAKYLVPGVPLLAKGSAKAGKLSGLATNAVNIGIEGAKIFAYIGIAEQVGGEDAARVAGAILMFGAGFTSSFSASWRREVGEIIQKGREGSERLVRALASIEDPQRVNDALRKTLSGYVDSPALGNFIAALEKRRNFVGGIEALLGECKGLAVANGEILGKNWLDKALELAKQEQIGGLRGYIVNARTTINRTLHPELPLPPAERASFAKRYGRGGKRSSGGGGGGNGSITRSEAKTVTNAAPSERPISSLERFVEKPPIELNLKNIAMLTNNRVVVLETAQKPLTKFYATHMDKRSLLWRLLGTLDTGRLRGFKKVKTVASGDALYAKAGDHRLFVQKIQDQNGSTTYIVTDIKKRGNLKKGTW